MDYLRLAADAVMIGNMWLAAEYYRLAYLRG